MIWQPTINYEMSHAHAECTDCRPTGKWILCAEQPRKVWVTLCMHVCVRNHACVWVWCTDVSATGGIIKGSNYRQTNELRALFSQTNKWADFNGTQRRQRNVWRAQAASSGGWWYLFQMIDISVEAGKLWSSLEISSLNHVIYVQYGRRTLSPLIPLGPGAPTSPRNPLSRTDNGFVSTRFIHAQTY